MSREFIYIGKGKGSPDQVKVRGVTFERKGDPQVVFDEAVANGLASNPEFEEVTGEAVDYGPIPEDALPDEVIASLVGRVEQLERSNDLLVSEVKELREQLGAPDPEATNDPVTPPDYKEGDARETVFTEIAASADWSKEHHSTRKRWANTLTEGQIATTEEADEVILNALVDREQNQD